MKQVSELTGAKLDYWVAKADEKTLMPDGDGGWFTKDGFEYSPSTEWDDGGPIIEREKIKVEPQRLSDRWQAEKWGPYALALGKTPLIAAMRCYVASKFGDEVDDSQT